MNSARTCAILLLAATTLGGALLAWRQYGELVELRAAAMNTDERADLQKRVSDLEKLNRELQDQLAAQRDPDNLDGILAAVPASDRSSRDKSSRGERSDRDKKGDSRSRGSVSPQATAMRELMSKPEVQAMLSLQQKGAVESRYAALFKNLNLPPEQIEKLKTLLADRATTMQDVASAAREQGLSTRENPEVYRKLFADAQATIDNNIKAAIGEAGFAQLKTYEQTLPQRNVVNDLQQRLSYTSTPLTAAQTEQMVQVLAANAPQRQAGSSGASSPGTPGSVDKPASDRVVVFSGPGGGGPGGPGMGMMFGSSDGGGRSSGGSAAVTPAAVAQAQSVLAGPQLAALQQIQQQQQSRQQLSQLMSETHKANRPPDSKKSGSGKPGTPAPTAGGTPPRKSGGG